MQITSYDTKFYIFYGRIYNLRDYSTYKVTIKVFFALNMKIGNILRSTILPIFHDSM